MMTTNIVSTKWHCVTDDPTINYDDNNGSETGQWPIATTSTATKWGHNNNNDKYDSRERRGIKTARTTTARARTMTARTTTARTITAKTMR